MISCRTWSCTCATTRCASASDLAATKMVWESAAAQARAGTLSQTRAAGSTP